MKKQMTPPLTHPRNDVNYINFIKKAKDEGEAKMLKILNLIHER